MKTFINKKGQSLVELAVSLPLIVLIIGFIITAGQLLNAKQLCQQAAFQGARLYAVGGDKANAEAAASQILDQVIGGSNPKVTVNGAQSFGAHITCETSIDIVPLFPLKTGPITGKITLMYEKK